MVFTTPDSNHTWQIPHLWSQSRQFNSVPTQLKRRHYWKTEHEMAKLASLTHTHTHTHTFKFLQNTLYITLLLSSTSSKSQSLASVYPQSSFQSLLCQCIICSLWTKVHSSPLTPPRVIQMSPYMSHQMSAVPVMCPYMFFLIAFQAPFFFLLL